MCRSHSITTWIDGTARLSPSHTPALSGQIEIRAAKLAPCLEIHPRYAPRRRPSVSLYVLPLVLCAMLLVLLVRVTALLFRTIRGAIAIQSAEFQVQPSVVRPGEGMRVWARVIPRSDQPLSVHAALTCTMFDHKERRLYSNDVTLAPIVGRPGEYAVFLTMPAYALRTGVVGDELSNLFSEDAHRLLVFWSVELEVRRPDDADPILKDTISVEVPEGKVLEPDRAYVERLIVDTCSAMHSDLVFNWLVQVAASDGVIVPRERELLHYVLAAAHNVTDPAAADARIAVEMRRDLQLDPHVLRKHLPPETLLAFYRFLYAMAWRDGHLDGREHDFLVDVLDKFGLDGPTVTEVEREVLRDMAQHAIH